MVRVARCRRALDVLGRGDSAHHGLVKPCDGAALCVAAGRGFSGSAGVIRVADSAHFAMPQNISIGGKDASSGG